MGQMFKSHAEGSAASCVLSIISYDLEQLTKHKCHVHGCYSVVTIMTGKTILYMSRTATAIGAQLHSSHPVLATTSATDPKAVEASCMLLVSLLISAPCY